MMEWFSCESMLTDRQIEIVNNWDDKDEGKKKEVRKKLKKSISNLPMLRELPPSEAREIMQSAILDYANMDEKSELTENDKSTFADQLDERSIIHNRYDEVFVRNSVAVLFNSVYENDFEKGVNDGIEGAVDWWENKDRIEETAFYRQDNNSINKGKFLNRIGYDYPRVDGQVTYEQYSNRTISLSQPPEIPGEKTDRKDSSEGKIPNRQTLKCIFYLQSCEHLIQPDLLDIFVEIDIFEIEIEEVEDHIQNGEYDDWFDDTDQGSPNIRDNRLTNSIIEAKAAINDSRDFAKKVAHHLNNPKNSSFNPAIYNNPNDNPPYFKWIFREYIELHRDYLENEGVFPQRSKILEYPELRIGAPDPSKLTFEID